MFFTPASRTIDLSGIINFDIKKLFAIINSTAGVIIYSATGGTTNGYTLYNSTTKVITLAYNTIAMTATDQLMIDL